jgi:hypothetical protein
MKKFLIAFCLSAFSLFGATNEYQHTAPSTVDVAMLDYEVSTNTLFESGLYLGLNRLEDTGYLFFYFTNALSGAQQAAYTNQINVHNATNRHPTLLDYPLSRYSLIPPAPNLYYLGASTSSWVDAHVATASVYIGGARISSDSSSNISLYGSQAMFPDSIIVTNRASGTPIRQVVVYSGSNTQIAVSSIPGSGGPRVYFQDQSGSNSSISYLNLAFNFNGTRLTNVGPIHSSGFIGDGSGLTNVSITSAFCTFESTAVSTVVTSGVKFVWTWESKPISNNIMMTATGFIPIVSGYYDINFGGSWGGINNATTTAQLEKNGTNIGYMGLTRVLNSSGDIGTGRAGGIIYATTGEHVAVYLMITPGGTISVSNATLNVRFLP